jgi:steroid delta-isomerase-like uncharacterized protein
MARNHIPKLFSPKKGGSSMHRFRFISYAAVAFFVLGLSASCTYSDKSAENNKAIAQRFIEEAWNKGNLAVVDELCATSFVDHGPASTDVIRGLDSLKQAINMYRNAFPDLQLTVEDGVALGGKVVTRWTVRGTHKGDLMGIAPTNKQITVTGISIDRIAGGKIEETWEAWDRMDLMQQLGVAPQMAKPAG